MTKPKTIPPDAVLLPTSWCIVRPQKDQYLFYNSRTDELHLIPRTGYYVYLLCDGLHTVKDVEETLSLTLGNDCEHLQPLLVGFLDKLLERGIIEISQNE